MMYRRQIRRLEEIVEIVSGQVDPRKEPFASMPHVGGDNIESDTGCISALDTAKERGLKSGKYVFDELMVLYSKIRPNLNKVALPDFEGICSADVYPLKPKPGQLDRTFLAHLLRSKEFLAYAQRHSSRTNIPKLNRPALLGFKARIPPLPEQRRIAAILDKADAIRRKRRETIRLTEELLRSAFIEMFGDPVTNPMGWDVLPLANVGVVQGGLQVTSRRKSNPIEVPYLRVANVFRDSLNLAEMKIIRVTERELARVALKEGDLLIVEGHGNPAEIGRASAWDGSIEPCVHQNHLIRVRLNRNLAEPRFMSAFLNSTGGRRQLTRFGKTTSGLNTISASNVKRTRVLCPPIQLQRGFSEIVDRVDRLNQKRRRVHSEIDTLFNSLVQRAFSGGL